MSQELKVDDRTSQVSTMIWENFLRNLRRKRATSGSWTFLRIGKLNVNRSCYRQSTNENKIKAETPNVYDALQAREENE